MIRFSKIHLIISLNIVLPSEFIPKFCTHFLFPPDKLQVLWPISSFFI